MNEPQHSDKDKATGQAPSHGAAVDTSSHPAFFDYYAAESASEASRIRLRHVRDIVIKVTADQGLAGPLMIADIGCGAGTSSLLWAEAGHRVIGIDVNEPLIELARQRAAEVGAEIEYRVGTATALPLADASVDVCMAAELLEHVQDWEAAVAEFIRVLKPGGFLWMSTTNTLCPVQAEFNLPAFSWYPKALKAHYIKLAQTTRPELANYATYPAFNWFTPYSLKRHLNERGMTVMDRFDVAYAYKPPGGTRQLLAFIRKVSLLRLLGHIFSPGSTTLAQKTVR